MLNGRKSDYIDSMGLRKDEFLTYLTFANHKICMYVQYFAKLDY